MSCHDPIRVVFCLPLRAFQYYQRKFTLDEQVQHNRLLSLMQLAVWMLRKWRKARERKAELEEQLEELRQSGAPGLSDDELRAEHNKQVKAQTKPLPREYSYNL